MEKKNQNRRAGGLRLALALLITASAAANSMVAPVSAETTGKLNMPKALPKKRIGARTTYTPDLLLVMPSRNAEDDDIKKALEDANGTVIGTMGEGRLKCLIVRTEKGKLEQTEKKLKKDSKHFATIGRNYKLGAHFIPNDSSFPSQWHLPAINCPKAWDDSRGGLTKIAIFDTGCQANIADLSGKTQKGYDATTVGARLTVLAGPGPLGDIAGAIGGALSKGAQEDVHGHGTWVATTAAATANNSTNTAGVAPGATVYPVQIAGSDGQTDDIAIMAGLLNMLATGNRIVNISYGAAPPFGLTNALIHAPLHAYMQEFHDLKGGLIFLSSGNDGSFDPNPPQHYYNVVTAIDNTMTLADFSNYGMSTTFTAPGAGILCSDRDGTVKSVNGTSFSSPVVAGIAALIWNANPALPNVWVEHILKASAIKAGSSPWTHYYGYGMPDARKAVKMARGGL